MNTIASTRRGILAAALVSLTALSAAITTTEAAVITWGAATDIAADTDVSTSGTLVGALNVGGLGNNVTLNGVTFTGATLTGVAVSSGVFTLSAPTGLSSQPSGAGGGPYAALSAAYQDLLNPIGGSSGTVTLTISGLVVGETYQFQWWRNNSAQASAFSTTATAGNSITLIGNDDGVIGGTGEFGIGTFIADNATQQIAFNASGGGSATFLNAFQLRQQSVPGPGTPVPEPGSALVGMLVLGLCGARFGRRSRP